MELTQTQEDSDFRYVAIGGVDIDFRDLLRLMFKLEVAFVLATAGVYAIVALVLLLVVALARGFGIGS